MYFSHYIEVCGDTHETLARRFGCTRSMITQIRSGKKKPSINMMSRIINATSGDVSADDLIREFSENTTRYPQ